MLKNKRNRMGTQLQSKRRYLGYPKWLQSRIQLLDRMVYNRLPEWSQVSGGESDATQTYLGVDDLPAALHKIRLFKES